MATGVRTALKRVAPRGLPMRSCHPPIRVRARLEVVTNDSRGHIGKNRVAAILGAG